MNKFQILAALAAMHFGTASVATNAGAESKHLIVSTAGLDLGTGEGVKALDLRITQAASALCGTPSFSDALGWKKFKNCRETVRESVARQRQAAIALANKHH